MTVNEAKSTGCFEFCVKPFQLGMLDLEFGTAFTADQVMMILHIVSGEIMLVAIPFTRLSHMLFSPFTRAYMGSEFGGIRHARDW